MSDKYLHIHAQLVTAAGGTVLNDSTGRPRFVTKPGVVLPYKPREFADDFLQVLEVLRTDHKTLPCIEHAEFSSRLVYLTQGNEDPELRDGDAYTRKVAHEIGHMGIAALDADIIYFAGISDEIIKELLAHRNGVAVKARVNRLTSANTKAMMDTLYAVSPYQNYREYDFIFVEEFLRWREQHLQSHPIPKELPEKNPNYEVEFRGRHNLCTKAISVEIAMSTSHWHKLFKGRMPKDGNEDEVRRLAARACTLLHERYPIAILTPQEYGYDLE